MREMMAVVVSKKGAKAKLAKTSIPSVGEHDVLVNVRAASLNPVDDRIRQGNINIALKKTPTFPYVMGYDFAGTVVKIGVNVTKFSIGDEVYGKTRNSRPGSFANFMAVNEADAALKPQKLTMAEAAAVPLVGLTAYTALHDQMELKPGQKILILAGSGGVGTTAIQIAKYLGAYVATTASPEGFELVKQMGADQVIDYHTTDFTSVLHDYDAVLDTQGGGELMKALQIVKPDGMVVSLAGLPDARYAKSQGLGRVRAGLFSIVSLKITKLARQRQVNYRFLMIGADGVKVATLTNIIEDGGLTPVIDRQFALSDAIAAIDYSTAGHAKGKIVLKMPKVSLN